MSLCRAWLSHNFPWGKGLNSSIFYTETKAQRRVPQLRSARARISNWVFFFLCHFASVKGRPGDGRAVWRSGNDTGIDKEVECVGRVRYGNRGRRQENKTFRGTFPSKMEIVALMWCVKKWFQGYSSGGNTAYFSSCSERHSTHSISDTLTGFLGKETMH